ncbi:MAG: hypothetical protein KDC35_07965 [Acidobacteria bacterium]|nr:hypothetical protein [Acidobacteriota bacterium]
MNEALKSLRDYQQILHRVAELERLMSFVPEDVRSLETEWQSMEARMAELKTRQEEQLATQKTQMLALEEATDKSKKFERDLNDVTNSKEYNAVIKEIDAIRKRLSGLNEDISQRMVELEDIETNTAECEQLAAESKSKYDEALAAFRATQSEIQTELNQRISERDQMKAEIPAALMKQFQRIADRRNGIGLALCVKSVCSACNVHIRQNVVEKIRHNNKVIQCDSCQRILYFEEEVLTT